MSNDLPSPSSIESLISDNSAGSVEKLPVTEIYPSTSAAEPEQEPRAQESVQQLVAPEAPVSNVVDMRTHEQTVSVAPGADPLTAEADTKEEDFREKVMQLHGP